MTDQRELFDPLQQEHERIKREKWSDEGTHCRACGRLVKVYRRKLYGGPSVGLLCLVQRFEAGSEWGHVRDLPPNPMSVRNDFAKLENWGLIEAQPNEHPNTKRCSGVWRPTPRGVDFAHDRIRVPSFALLCDNEIEGWSDELVSIRDVLPEDFDYEEIWRTEEFS